jgi:ubiquinone/menaquinone biosynthesis C-methylase UbiE
MGGVWQASEREALGAGFWVNQQPGFRFTDAERGSREFFEQVERHRYALEPHIPEIVRFADWAGKDVLEAGCGVATDGIRFVRSGARYTGLDGSETAIDLARRRVGLEHVEARFVLGSVTDLPFEDASFDLVYSHGVIHHVLDTEAAVAEFHRVLRPGGTVLVMLYHRASFNYHVSIMGVRRALAALLLVPGGTVLVSRITREDTALLEAHRELLRRHGYRYLTDKQLFLSNNTDGPGNPLSKVYSRDEAARLFAQFESVQLETRYLNLRLYPGGSRVASTALARRLERRIGWHLYVRATKRER